MTPILRTQAVVLDEEVQRVYPSPKLLLGAAERILRAEPIAQGYADPPVPVDVDSRVLAKGRHVIARG